jgi:hypothetical protein
MPACHRAIHGDMGQLVILIVALHVCGGRLAEYEQGRGKVVRVIGSVPCLSQCIYRHNAMFTLTGYCGGAVSNNMVDFDNCHHKGSVGLHVECMIGEESSNAVA